MVTVATLVGIAFLAFLGAPSLLGRGDWRIRHPELCLRAWAGLFAVGLGCAAAGVAVAVVIGVTERLALVRHGWLGPTSRVVAAWIALGLAGGVMSLVGTKVAAMVVTERRLRADFDRLTAEATTRRQIIAGLSVHIVEGHQPIACSLRRRGGQVLISTAVSHGLGPRQLAALVAHEHAHLRGLHDVICRVAALNAACLPGFLTPVVMQQSTRLLIELAADRSAARRVGPATMAATLRSMAQICHTDSLLLRAELLIPATQPA